MLESPPECGNKETRTFTSSKFREFYVSQQKKPWEKGNGETPKRRKGGTPRWLCILFPSRCVDAVEATPGSGFEGFWLIVCAGCTSQGRKSRTQYRFQNPHPHPPKLTDFDSFVKLCKWLSASKISKPIVWGTRGLHPGFPWLSSFPWFPLIQYSTPLWLSQLSSSFSWFPSFLWKATPMQTVRPGTGLANHRFRNTRVATIFQGSFRWGGGEGRLHIWSYVLGAVAKEKKGGWRSRSTHRQRNVQAIVGAPLP